MRTLSVVALLALCFVGLAGCGADNDPVGLQALPTDPGHALTAAPDNECECECGEAIRPCECGPEAEYETR